jgi:transcription elongation factor GreA
MVEKIPMTREGYELLMLELKRLKDVERPKIAKEIGVAREHGDLSENAEYDAAKDKQGLIEGRIKELEHKVACAELVDISKATPGTVVFGATVSLEDEDTGGKVTYRIVGADESDIKQKKISINSPIARALIGRKVGDSVEVQIPAGEKEFTILDVIFD